ncbi:MAG TPA: two-component regulator propeller domain-containing protein [Parafilimonas sp.]|nr:two-component regulator propeller domain-containing protein [Parafilimonas sp.]
MYYRKLLLYFACFFLLFHQNLAGQFPGYYVQHFNSDNGMQNTVKGLQPDNNGFIWIATESGLVRFDGRAFTLFDHADNGTPVNRLADVGISKKGQLYVEAGNNGHYYMMNAVNELEDVPAARIFNDSNSFRISISYTEKLYNACKKKYDEKTIAAWAIPGLKQFSFFLTTSIVYSNGWLFYLNKDLGLVAADTALTTFHRLALPGLKNPVTKGNNLAAPPASLMQYGNDIYLRWADSIYALRFSSTRAGASLHAVLYVGDIPNVMGFLPLPAYNMFIAATVADGIYVFQKQVFSTLVLHSSQSNIFYAQAPFGKDGVLTNAGVLSPGKFTPLPINFDPRFIFHARNGDYYVLRREQDEAGISRLDKNLDVTKRILSTDKSGVRFMEMQDGSTWLSLSASFLGRLVHDSVQWLDKPAGLPDEFFISDLLEAGKNNVWIAGNKGVVKYDISTRALQVIPGIVNIPVRSLYKDASGVLWIGTYGNGFYAWHNNRLTVFPLDEDKYLAYVHTFMEDKTGHLWISTNHGLFECLLNDLHRYIDTKKEPPYYYYFDRTAGFLTNEFNGGCSPAGIVLGNGKFSLPSLNGLVQFYPDSIKPAFPNTEIFVDNIIADTSVIPLTGKAITIPHDVNRLRFYIVSPYFGNSYNQHIEYNIDKSNAWYPLNDDYIIELNNMRKGEHSIALRKQAGFGENNFITKEIAFTVEPAFYETNAFKLLLLAAFLLLLYCLYRLRIRYLVGQKERLEKEVAEKTKEQHVLINNLETVVAELEASKTDLQKTALFKEALAMIITHDLQSPLRFLSDAMERMHEINKNADADTKELSVELKNTSANIHHFVEDFGIWIKKVNIAGNLNVKPVNIAALLAELEIFFSELQKTNGNKIIAEALPAINVYADYQLLKIILRNIIDNANKHTHAGTICIKLCAANNIATIAIADTGDGMKPELLQKLIQCTQQNASFGYNKEINGIGFGYRFITDFCRMLDISLDMKSKLAEGTTVTLSNLKINAANNS